MFLYCATLKSLLLIVVGTTFLLLPPPPCLARKWSDNTGTYSVEAELVSVRADIVQLKRQDGKLIAVPLSRLSAADRSYVAETEKTASAPPKPSPVNQDRSAASQPQRKRVFVQPIAVEVTRVEKDVVEVNVGSDCLKKGDRLVIHSPSKGKYKGTIEILETGPEKSVGKVIPSLNNEVAEPGDRAWCRDWVALPCTVDGMKKVLKENSDGANKDPEDALKPPTRPAR